MQTPTSPDMIIHRRELDVFGFTVFRELFAADEVAAYARAMEDVHRHQRGGADFTGEKTEKATPLVELNSKVFEPLLDDERLVGVVEALLGEDCLYTGSNDGNLYVGDTPWHVDGGGLATPLLLKTAFYCDSIREGSGALSVLPGSHHNEYFQLLYRAFFEERSLDAKSPAIPGRTAIASDSGDLIIFDHRLWHSAWGGRAGRRQIAFSWVAAPKKSWEQLWLQGYLTWMNQRNGKRLLSDRLHQEGGSRRKRKLARLLEMGL